MEQRYLQLDVGAPCVPADDGSETGFTLIELTVLVVIMILVTAVSLPGLSGTVRTLSLKTSAREISSTCRLARNLAITSKTEHRVLFDIEKHIYRIEGPGALQGLKVNRKIADGLSLSQDCDPEDFPGATESKFVFIFFAGGFTSGGCINLSNGAANIALRLDPITGRMVCGKMTESPE